MVIDRYQVIYVSSGEEGSQDGLKVILYFTYISQGYSSYISQACPFHLAYTLVCQ